MVKRELQSTETCLRACLAGFLGVLLLISSCIQQKDPVPPMGDTESRNKKLLDEANLAAKWFRAKKTRPIWAKRLETAQVVKTLEGEEQVEAGHFLCKGEAADQWPQTEENLNKRYTPTNEVDAEGWKKYLPHPDAQGVMATAVDHPFEVHSQFGKLSGKAGDFLVKNFQDRQTDYPKDVWIVDQVLFGQTYSKVTEK